MTKTVLTLMAVFLFGCSTNSETDAQGASYESKELIRENVNSIEVGTGLEEVYDTLGAPLKEWTSEFVYEELENSISTNELVMLLMIANGRDEDHESFNPNKKSIEEAEKALKIDKLTMLQYTYTLTIERESKETALFWISPRTDTVVAISKQGYMNENGERADVWGDVDTSENEESTDESSDEDTYLPSDTYEIGDTVSFNSESGDKVDVSIDEVTKFMGDDWDTPEGHFFAKVDFTVTNNGPSVFDVNSHYFEFYDAEDIKSNRISKDYFREEIQSGKTAKGTAYYDVLSEGSTFEVFFGDTNWAGEY